MRIVCLVFFILLFQFTHAQESQSDVVQDTVLTDILNELEERYNVKFSYNPQLLVGKRIGLDINTSSLQESILEIENIFKIVFEKIDGRYYTIKKQTKNISICGYLKDKENGTAIEGVTIINTATQEGVISDEQGFFKLENNGENDKLDLSFLGYKTLVLQVNQIQSKSCIIYTLSSENYELDEVVVQEYLGVGVAKARDGSIKIDPNNLNILSGLSEPDILQNIQLLPGIESPGETASGLYIRGGTPDQNLILWDGIKMYNSNHFFGMISAFNPYIVDGVSVSRGGTDPRYGDRISGVIDITTDNIVPQKVEGQIGLNPIHADAHIKMPITKDFGLFLSGRRSLVEIFRSPTFVNFSEKVFQNTIISEDPIGVDSNFIEEEGIFNFFDVTLKGILNLSKKDKITVSTLLTRNKLDYSLQADEVDEPSNDRLRIKNYGTSASWSHFSSDYFKLKNEIYYSQYNFNYSGQNPFIEGGVVTEKNNIIKEFGYSVNTDWKINDSFTFINGYQFFSNQVSYSLIRNNTTISDNSSGPTNTLYSQLKYEEANKWHIDAGIRMTYYTSLNTFYTEPRIYIERIFGDHFRFKMSAEVKNQAVSQIIEFTTQEFGLENQVWALADEDFIPLLRSNQLSGGFLFEKKGWNMDLDIYFKNIDGFTTLSRGFESSVESISEGNSRISGIDVLLKKKINNYVTWFGYTYSTIDFLFEDLNQGKRFKGNSNIKHSLTWSQFYQWKDLQFSLGWKYRTGTPYTQATGFTDDPNNVSLTYGAINSKILPDYHRLDFSVLYDFILGKKSNAPSAKLGVSISNIYGRRNILSRNYGLFEEVGENGTPQNNAIREIDKYSLGRTPSIFFRVKF